MPLFRKRQPGIAWDPQRQRPAVRRSICTGEMTAGFIDRETGAFQDLLRVDGRKGLEDFCKAIGAKVEDVEEIY